MKINGWNIPPTLIITLAINLIGWGITIGTILTKLDALDYRIHMLEHPAEASERK